MSKEKEEKENNLQLNIGNGSAINPEGWQVEERDFSLCNDSVELHSVCISKGDRIKEL